MRYNMIREEKEDLFKIRKSLLELGITDKHTMHQYASKVALGSNLSISELEWWFNHTAMTDITIPEWMLTATHEATTYYKQ